MAHRSLIRPDQLDSNGAYSFAQLNIDGYSGGFLEDGYLMGLVLTDGYESGSDTIHMDAHDGAINQIGSGQVQFTGNVDAKDGLDVTGDNLTVSLDAIIDGNLRVKTDTVLEGDLIVQGTTTTIDTDQMIVQDPVTVLNANGSELTTHFTGFSARDADGYNRIGWVFEEGGTDGYWAVSSIFSDVSTPDLPPDHALAFLGTGETNGDLSSTVNGDSGADKIGVSSISGVAGSDVQTVLENLASGSAELDGSTTTNFTINTDADAGTDEDACLIMKGGDGTSLIEGYMCLVTNGSTNDDYFQFRIYDDAADADVIVHIGENGTTDDVNATMFFNAGTGTDAYQASIALSGDSPEFGELVYTSAQGHEFSGNVQMLNNLDVDGNANVDGTLDVTGAGTFSSTVDVTGTFSADGDVNLGDDSSDSVTVSGTITSDLSPTDDTYYLGGTTNRWVDAYFSFFTPTNYTPVGDNDSLEGHLKGIDAALADAAVDHPRGVYDVTSAEASIDEIDSSRAVDLGDIIDVSGLTDAEFQENILIYWNGQLVVNDSAPAADSNSVSWDVARKTGSLGTLVFSGNLRKAAVIQIIDLR